MKRKNLTNKRLNLQNDLQKRDGGRGTRGGCFIRGVKKVRHKIHSKGKKWILRGPITVGMFGCLGKL